MEETVPIVGLRGAGGKSVKRFNLCRISLSFAIPHQFAKSIVLPTWDALTLDQSSPRVLARMLMQEAGAAPAQEPTALAAIFTDKPRMAALKKKDSTDCASTALRAGRDITATSDVCAATAMVKEKYRKSQ